MIEVKEEREIKKDLKEQAFLLQFGGNENHVKKKIGLTSSSDYGCPVHVMKWTGLFGVLEALIDLHLTDREVRDFYIHGHMDPYDDPYQFTKGIVELVQGLPKADIKNKYGYFFNDDRIEKLSKPNRNTQMLLSFCYSKDDTYEFIPDKNELYKKFAYNYESVYNDRYEYKNEKEFQKIDGKLFRAIRFLVRQGYDFPELECIMNEQIQDIVFKETNGENIFILNKQYAREISDDVLSFVCFLNQYNYNILNPQFLFDIEYDTNNLLDPSGKLIALNHSHLESDVNKYTAILKNLSHQNFEVPKFIGLCDKRVQNFVLKYIDDASIEHSLTINRDMLETIPQELLKVIKKAYDLGFTFPDNDNLFDQTQKLLKVKDSNGIEYLVVREQFNSMLEIIIKCKKSNFRVNLSQLFDTNQNEVELVDELSKKGNIKRDQIINIMTAFELLTQNGYRFHEYSNLFDETQPYIASYDEQNQERLLSRKQINKIIRIEEILDKRSENLTDSEKDLLSMLNNYGIRQKLFKWLPYTAKKWIPSSAVINKIPAEQSYNYFYNNNHIRFKELKDKYQASSYTEMEGILSLGYILGLFDSKGSTSEKAVEYIIQYFLKKGVTADELHTTYGAIDLKKGYNPKFAEFFMRHYAIDSQAFIEPDLGTNMVGELFARFDEVLENRPEKRIKTRTINQLLTPIDAMAAITHMKVDREILGEKVDDERYIRLVELLTKFGASKDELKWAIELYEKALAIDEANVKIPYIEDVNTTVMTFTSHLKSDPQAFVSGRKTNCCSKYGGYAQDRLTHVITDPNWRYVTFTSPNRTFFDGLVWYDQEEQVVCIDNVEGQFSKIDKKNDSSIAMMADTVIRYADGIYHKMNELHIPCTKVNVGKDRGTASWEIFNYAWQQKLIREDNNPCNYPRRNSITTDADNQFTITDEQILRLRGKH